MLHTSLQSLTTTFQSYFKKTPDPLNRQFPERLDRKEAIKRQTGRKQHASELFPSGSTFTIDFCFVYL